MTRKQKSMHRRIEILQTTLHKLIMQLETCKMMAWEIEEGERE